MIALDMTKGNAEKYPNKTAVIVGDTRFTFKQLHERVCRLSKALSAMGLKKGDLYAVCAETCAQHIEIVYASIETGVPIMVLNSSVSEEGFSHQINIAKVECIILSEECYNRFESSLGELKSVKNCIVIGSPKKGVKNYEEFIASYPPEEVPEVYVNYDDIVWITSSSGTTGFPKLIMRSYETSLALGLRFGYGLNLTGDDIFLSIGSPSMAFCLCRVIGYLGTTFIMANELSPEGILGTIEREHVTKIFCGSIFIRGLLKYAHFNKFDISSLKRVIAVGTPLDVEEWKRAIELFGNIFVQVYGSVEDTPTCFLYPEDIFSADGQLNLSRLKAMGRVAPGAHVKVVDETGKEVQPGATGELITKGETLMKGYYNEPTKTQEVIKGGYYYTGDLVKMDEEGYIYFIGRKQDAIFTCGEVVFPNIIEGVISRLPQVKEVAVIGIPDEKMGQKIKAVIVLNEGDKTNEEEIINYCKNHLKSYEIPHSSLDFVSSLPKGVSGKVLKSEIMKKYL